MTAIPPTPSRSLGHLPDGSPAELPALVRQVVRLRLTHRKRFPFQHGAVIQGLLCRLLGHDLPRGLIPTAAESGRSLYAAGDAYHWGLTWVGEAGEGPERLEPALASLAVERPASGPRRKLHGNFVVEGVSRLEPLELDSVRETAARMARAGEVRLRFTSPLLLRRPPELRRPGREHFDADCFPADSFLALLWKRWCYLTRGAYPPWEAVPPRPEDLRARPGRWLRMPVSVRGPHDGPRSKRGGFSFDASMGEVVLEGLTPGWCRLLALMRHLHIGKSLHYGLGRFSFPDLENQSDPMERPGTPALERLLDPQRLYRALDREARRGRAGVDGVTPEAFLADAPHQLDALTTELRAGTYRPGALAAHAGRLVSPVRDRVVQRALVELLRPSLEALAHDLGPRYGPPPWSSDPTCLPTLFPGLEAYVSLLAMAPQIRKARWAHEAPLLELATVRAERSTRPSNQGRWDRGS